MDNSKLKFFVFAPEASALVSRRIHGLGMASGVDVGIASHLSDLPRDPSPHDILVQLQGLAPTSNPPKDPWPQVLTIIPRPFSQMNQQISQQMNQQTSLPSIFAHEPMTTWTQIFGAAIALHRASHRPHSWHCANLSLTGEFIHVYRKIDTWAQSLCFRSYGQTQWILAGLDRIATACGRKVLSLDTTMNASMDGIALTLSIMLAKPPQNFVSACREFVAAPLSTYASFRNINQDLLLQFKLDFLGRPNFSAFSVFRNVSEGLGGQTRSDETGDAVDQSAQTATKEAS